MIEWSYRVFTAFLPVCVAFILCSRIITGDKLSPRRMLLAFFLYYVEGFLAANALGPDSPYKLLLITCCILLVFMVVHRFRGQRLLLNTFIMLLVTFTGDVIAGIVTLNISTPADVAEMRYASSDKTYFLQLLCSLFMVLNALLWRGGSHLLQRVSKLRGLGFILRPMLMLTIIGVLFMLALLRVDGNNQLERLRQVLPDFIVIALLLGIGITYVIQDIRHFRQLQENNTLLYQQSLQQLLLQETRVFRHNIANMLYGLQGLLLRDNLDELNAYYKHMVEACQVINNDNVVALKRIPSVAISSLLLNKVQEANAKGIPFYITVEDDVHWHALSDVDMTVVLGCLLDNALEAAQEASAPHVSFEARNAGKALSLTIRNTYRDGEPPIFTVPMPSTKPDHNGLGLASVRKLLHKSRKTLFNIYPTGRYVEASIICY
ncbi:MAG: GHKL domain-containing protein [Clostridia bacterium]|nr:GHKL domain-containing protein [Clostridia bacterium]